MQHQTKQEGAELHKQIEQAGLVSVRFQIKETYKGIGALSVTLQTLKNKERESKLKCL